MKYIRHEYSMVANEDLLKDILDRINAGGKNNWLFFIVVGAPCIFFWRGVHTTNSSRSYTSVELFAPDNTRTRQGHPESEVIKATYVWFFFYRNTVLTSTSSGAICPARTAGTSPPL